MADLIKAYLYLPEIRKQKVEHQIECKHYDDHYEYIARILKEMKKFEGGNAVVKAMAEKFKVMYKRRPAMIDILCEF